MSDIFNFAAGLARGQAALAIAEQKSMEPPDWPDLTREQEMEIMELSALIVKWTTQVETFKAEYEAAPCLSAEEKVAGAKWDILDDCIKDLTAAMKKAKGE